MRPLSRKSYASLVDVAISNGHRMTAEAGLPYDIRFFAKAMWTAYPFMRKTREVTDLDSPIAKLTILFMTAVQAGNASLTRDCLNRMRRQQRKLKFRMPEAQRFPEPTLLRKKRRKQVAKMERKAVKEQRPYAQQVDDAIARGLSQTKEVNRRSGLSRTYDIVYFAHALWRAQPFMEFALRTDVDNKSERKFRVLRQDFLIAVYDGNKGAVTGMLADMVRMGKKHGITLLAPSAVTYPTPAMLLN